MITKLPVFLFYSLNHPQDTQNIDTNPLVIDHRIGITTIIDFALLSKVKTL